MSTGLQWFTLVAAAIATLTSAKATEIATTQVDEWRKREESMRMLRWGVEHAIRVDPVGSRAGLHALRALRHGALVQPVDRGFVDRVTEAVIAEVSSGLGDQDHVVVDDGGQDEL